MGRFSEEEWGVMSYLLQERYGLVFEGNRRSFLEERLSARLALFGMGTLTEYCHHIRFHPDRAAELLQFQDLVTNHESYFFRDRQRIDMLTLEAVPLLAKGALQRSGWTPLRILSAGCASGEEPYSLAIALREAGVGFPGIAWEIFAIDISGNRIAQAKDATYDEPSVRDCDAAALERYFIREGARFVLRQEYRRGVRIFEGNILGEPSAAEPASYDVIFCRNVLIYFSEHAMNRAITRFHRSLAPGGILFLGHSEFLLGRRDFEPVRLDRGLVYRKVESPA
jgi:chemotaxis methyl-accepting protein methylase